MKRSLLLLFLLFEASSGYAQTPLDKWPRFEDVVSQFYLYYSTEDLPQNVYLQFARKPSGWYVLELDSDKNYAVINQQLYYSPESDSYQDLTYTFLPEVTQEAIDNIGAHLSANDKVLQQDSAMFSENYYYGYTGWETDVIAALQMKKDRSLKEEYQLARAYSSGASYLIWPRLKESWAYLPFDYNFNPDNFSKEELNAYLLYRNLAIESYKRIIEKDKRFPTFVGDAQTSFSNEYLTAYTELSFIGQKELAGSYLKDNLYNDFKLDLFRMFLSSCDSNAILFTGGDLDTYVLLYLQKKLHVREDVTVVNTSLSNTGRYIHYLSEALPEASFSPEILSGGNLEYVYVKTATDEPVRTSDFLERIKRKDSADYLKDYKAYMLPGNQVEIAPEILIPLDYQYLLLADLYIYDLISQYYGKKPVYFASTAGPVPVPDPFLDREGLVRKFLPDAGAFENISDSICNRLLSLNYSFVRKADTLSSHELGLIEALQINNFLYPYYDLQKRRDSGARKFLEKFLEVFSRETVPYSSVTVYLVKALYEEGMLEEGDEIALKAAHESFEKAKNLISSSYNEQLFKNEVAILKGFSEATEEYDRKKVNKKIEDYIGSIKKAYSKW